MKYPFCEKQLYEVSQKLASVAMGNQYADLVIQNCTLINVCTKEFMHNTDIAISEGRICYIGNANHCIGEDTKIIDASGLYASPAFIDAHLHVESSLITPFEYAKAVVPHGTAHACIDPHEICNVCGKDGVKFMLDNGSNAPLKFMAFMPSCVPSMPDFEDGGAVITAVDVGEMMQNDKVFGLGEMMNYVGISLSTPQTHSIVAQTLKFNKAVSGHFSTPDKEKMLNAYFTSGPQDCHESVTRADALEKLRRGVKVFFREGSAAQNLEELSTIVTENDVDTRGISFCTDDIHPDVFSTKGHIDYVVRRAISLGIPTITAYQMATINPAEAYGIQKDAGSITLGKMADILLIDDVEKVNVCKVFINGKLVAQDGEALFNTNKSSIYPDFVLNTVKLKNDLSLSDFAINTRNEFEEVRVIKALPSQILTVKSSAKIKSYNGNLISDTNQDVLKAVVYERHHDTKTKGMGFVHGFGLKRGAIASTVAHDCHNLIVIGVTDSDMLLATKTLQELGGGMCVVKDGKVLSTFALPIAGLMSKKTAKDTAKEMEELKSTLKELDCILPEPFMTMSFLSLACIPSLRLTNRGLVDTDNFKFVDLIIK